MAAPVDRRRLLQALPALIAACLALVGLGRQPLWYDEIASAVAAGRSWPRLLTLLSRTDGDLGLYYGALHLWQAASSSAFALRLPSAVAAVATVLLLQRAGTRLVGPGTAAAAAALLAVDPFFVAYARDTRPYALATAAATGALLLALRAQERPTLGRLAASAAAAALTAWLHLFAGLVVAGVAVALLPHAGRARRRWALTQVAVAVASLPVVLVSVVQRAQIGWVPPLTVLGLLRGLALLAGGALPLALLGVATAVVLRSRRLPRRVLLVPLLLPVAVLVVVSLVSPAFVPRYLLSTAPYQCLVVAAAARQLLDATRRSVRVAASATVSSLVCWQVVASALLVGAPFHYEDYRQASRAVLQSVRAGDGIVYAQQGARLGMDFYLERLRRPGQQPPRDVLELPGPEPAFAAPVLTGPAARAALAPLARVWLVRHLESPPQVLLPAGWQCDGSRTYGVLSVRLCSRPGRACPAQGPLSSRSAGWAPSDAARRPHP